MVRRAWQGWCLGIKELMVCSAYMIIIQTISFMNNFQDDYESWKDKLSLAKQGNSQAIEHIKNYIMPHIDSDHPLATVQFTQLIKQSSIHCLQKENTYGMYDVYSKVPIFFLVQGKAAIQCINTQGDTQIISDTAKVGLLDLTQTELKIKYGQSNISLITQFQVYAQEKSIIIQFVPKSAIPSQPTATTNTITLREQAIMKKYMLIALKHITKFTYSKQKTTLSTKFYLLQGRACYINSKTKSILCCYQQGFFSPSLPNTDFSLYIFNGAYIMLLEEQMLKEELVSAIQNKRGEHIQAIQKKYDKMGKEERQKLQELLIQKYSLNRQEVNREILGIEQKPVDKFMKSKNDFIRTSSSMKEKCGIRIRKSKKIN